MAQEEYAVKMAEAKKAAAASKAFEETTMLSTKTQAASSWKIWG